MRLLQASLIFFWSAGFALTDMPSLRGPKPARILVLFSYHPAAWSDSVLSGIRSVLPESDDRELLVEYMDTKRQDGPVYLGQLADVFQLKYHSRPPDAMILVDDNALQFHLANADSLWGHVPASFCGVNRFDNSVLATEPGLTGVIEKGDFHSNLELLHSVRPDMRRLYVIGDSTATGLANQSGLLAELNNEFPSVRPVLLVQKGLRALDSTLRSADPADAAFFVAYWRAPDGSTIPQDSLGNVFRHSAVPVFGRSEWMLGRGLVGGICVVGSRQGREAALRLKELLRTGKTPPVLYDSPNESLFDARELARFGIDPSLLPEGSRILFATPSVRVDRWVAILSGVLVLLLAGGSLLLFRKQSHLMRLTQKLGESEERYRLLAHQSSDMISLHARDGSFLYASPAARPLLGVDPESLLGTVIYDRIHPDDKESRLASHLERLWREGRHSVSCRMQHTNGSWIWVEASTQLVEDANGETRIVATTRDIRERMRIEQELRDKESRYRLLVENQSDLVVKLDSEGKIVFASPSFLAFFHTREESVLGRPFQPLSVEASATKRSKVLRSPAGYLEERAVGAWGTRWIGWNLRTLYDDGGTESVIAVGRDITRNKESEQEREVLIRELGEKNEELERYAYTVSHDLRSPLVTIVGFVDEMKLSLSEQDATGAIEAANHVSTAAKRMGSLLEGLLRLSRVGMVMNAPTRVELDELARVLQETMHGPLSRRNVVFEVDPGMPAVWGDAPRLQEILQNLVENAVKYMGDQPKPHIRLSAEVQQGYAVVTVADNGMGLEPAERQHLFELFHKLDPRSEGAGVGLALVKRIVEHHGGRVWVDSEGRGKGSSFLFTVPLAKG